MSPIGAVRIFRTAPNLYEKRQHDRTTIFVRSLAMDIKTIGVEEWLNVWEKSATWDIAQSTISSLTMGELRALQKCFRI